MRRRRGIVAAVVASVLLALTACSPGNADGIPDPPKPAGTANDDVLGRIWDMKPGDSVIAFDMTVMVSRDKLDCWVDLNTYYPRDPRYHWKDGKLDDAIRLTRKADGFYVNEVHGAEWWPRDQHFNQEKGFVPVKNCAGMDQPSSALAPTENRLPDKYRVPTVFVDLKAQGTGWVHEEPHPEQYTFEEPPDGSGPHPPDFAVLVPDAPGGTCRIDPQLELLKTGNPAKGDVQVGWNGHSYTILTPHRGNASLIQKWQQYTSLIRTDDWFEATCPVG